MKNNFYRKNNKKSGFTLMETLVAIFIIMLAITGPMVFTQNALRSAFLSRDQITAFFLAQDSIEYIKNIRDGHVVDIIKSSDSNPSDWLGNGNLKNYCMDSTGCTVDTLRDESGIKSCSGDSEPGCVKDDNSNQYKPLNYYEDNNGDSYFTTQPIGSNIKPSLFAREIKITNIQTDKEAQITVTVRWKSHEGVGVREIVVRENIYNWSYALLNQ